MTELLPPPDVRIPMPLDQALSRMRLTGPQRPLSDVLDGVVTNRTVLQDYTPVDSCLEAQLSDAVWKTCGVLLFAENDVPYAINNTSQLSDQASAILFRNCLEH